MQTCDVHVMMGTALAGASLDGGQLMEKGHVIETGYELWWECMWGCWADKEAEKKQ